MNEISDKDKRTEKFFFCIVHLTLQAYCIFEHKCCNKKDSFNTCLMDTRERYILNLNEKIISQPSHGCHDNKYLSQFLVDVQQHSIVFVLTLYGSSSFPKECIRNDIEINSNKVCTMLERNFWYSNKFVTCHSETIRVQIKLKGHVRGKLLVFIYSSYHVREKLLVFI